ncbi:hypothetical protein C100_00600 [Sphingobium sp. C100]|uniref:HvfC/BufC N-terminal domain-containing protein n=1 Tax=Sphingobium sp. C100 TaxID=1207055 RepID=UPI0003D64F6B|nr:DNA-binding domain-containing protein [Sphingobium sp. C100]ETI65674.1 hypothetical protein C100_00600 [Sphingobium sp. C100]
MTLLSMQRDMRAWLVHEDEAAAARMGARAHAGFGVYQNNYRAQLVACLESSFPRTRAWTGDEAFLNAAALHIDRVPPSSWTLDAYPHDFPTTLSALYPDDPEIEEIAQIELALEQMFVAADGTIVTVDDLQDIDWDRASLRIAHTIELVDLRTNAFALWSAIAAGDQPPTVEHRKVSDIILVWRQDGQCRIRTIDQTEFQALRALRAGTRFGDLCSDAAILFGQERGTALVGQWLGKWLADGLIAAID